MPLETQSYLTQLTKLIFWLQSIIQQGDQLVATLKSVLTVTSVRFLDLTYVLVKAFRKNVNALTNNETLMDACQFMHGVLEEHMNLTWGESKIHQSAKVIQSSLKVFYKLWKRALVCRKSENSNKDHAEFRTKVVKQLSQLAEKFPNNSTFTAKVIQIHTLAALFAATVDADSFEATENQV